MEGVIVLVIIAWLIPKLINAVKKAGKSGKQAQSASRPAAAPRQTPSVQMNRPAPAMKRQTPGVAHSAHRDFSAPDAPCIVCEQTGEDHFQRDGTATSGGSDPNSENGTIPAGRRGCMKNKMFPFPVLLGIFGIIAEFLVGSTPGLRSALFVTLMFIVCWYAAGPEMKPPVHPNFDNRKATVFDPKSPQEHYEEELNFWYWSKRLYEDRAFRNGAIVFALSFVLAGTLALTCFSEQVLLWRGILVMSLCALGPQARGRDRSDKIPRAGGQYELRPRGGSRRPGPRAAAAAGASGGMAALRHDRRQGIPEAAKPVSEPAGRRDLTAAKASPVQGEAPQYVHWGGGVVCRGKKKEQRSCSHG